MKSYRDFIQEDYELQEGLFDFIFNNDKLDQVTKDKLQVAYRARLARRLKDNADEQDELDRRLKQPKGTPKQTAPKSASYKNVRKTA